MSNKEGKIDNDVFVEPDVKWQDRRAKQILRQELINGDVPMKARDDSWLAEFDVGYS